MLGRLYNVGRLGWKDGQRKGWKAGMDTERRRCGGGQVRTGRNMSVGHIQVMPSQTCLSTAQTDIHDFEVN